MSYVTVEIYWKESDGSVYHSPVTIRPEKIDSHIKELNERWRLWDGSYCWVKRPRGRPRKVDPQAGAEVEG